MNSVTTVPWLTASPSEIEVEVWMTENEDGPQILPQRLDGWDAAMNLLLNRTVVIQADAVRRECGIAGPLRLSAVWWCPGTNLGRPLAIAEILPNDTEITVTLEGIIKGEELSERLILRTLLVLPAGTYAEQLLSACRPGSVLWEDSFEIVLEGTASRFPTEIADFSAMNWPAEAGWRLHWEDDALDAPFGRAVRLYLNETNKAVCITATAARAPEHRVISSVIRFDIARSLLTHGLCSEEFLQNPSGWPDDSVAGAISRMLEQYFPNDTPQNVAQMLSEDSECFSTNLQAALHLFEGL